VGLKVIQSLSPSSVCLYRLQYTCTRIQCTCHIFIGRYTYRERGTRCRSIIIPLMYTCSAYAYTYMYMHAIHPTYLYLWVFIYVHILGIYSLETLMNSDPQFRAQCHFSFSWPLNVHISVLLAGYQGIEPFLYRASVAIISQQL
jgi:hypothetical protein